MKQIFFILGRNPKLSYHEIIEFLKTRNRNFTETLFQENILILQVPKDEQININELGGTLHIGEITFYNNEEKLKNFISQNEIIPADKFSFATHGNLDPQIIKEKFKSMRKKASHKHGKKLLKLQNGNKLENPKANFHILFHKEENKILLGIATQSYDPKQTESRDMQKPIRREELAISPRLAKILINLSGAKPHNKLLDPFCGIGTILSEALIKKINVHGIDKDSQAIKDSQQNLEWLTKNYNIKNKYTLENKDSRKTPDLQFNAITTETPLGKLLTKKPSDNQAKQLIQNFEALIIPILSRLKKSKKPSAKIAITFPVIRNFHTDYQKIAIKSGLKIHLQPILESRKDQFVSRDILVLQ
jgi:tRNA G10  N-methylase Trm11